MTTASAVVAARSLAFGYPSGRRGLAGIDLDVEPGERVLVLGPNGSGKSTLIHLLAGLLKPTSGTVSVLGVSADGRSLPRRRMGVALDRVAHWEPLDALENLVLLARAAGMRPAAAAAAGAELLARFGLDARVRVQDCSLGMRRKLLLAEALVHAPDLLLLDEPTLGVDPAGLEALDQALGERTRAGAAAVIASNDLRAADALGARIVFLVAGTKVADQPAAKLLAALRARTRLEVTLAEDGERPDELAARWGPSQQMPLRPEGDAVVAESLRGAEPLPELLRWLLDQGARIKDVRVREPDLGDVYRHLTGESLEGGTGGSLEAGTGQSPKAAAGESPEDRARQPPRPRTRRPQDRA